MITNIRPWREEDRNFILSSWYKTYKDSPGHRRISPDTGMLLGALFNHLLDSCGALVLCNPDDTNQIYSWICGAYYGDEELLIHWVYTKKIYRSLGFAKKLYNFINPKDLNALTAFKSNIIDTTKVTVYDPKVISALSRYKDIKIPIAIKEQT